MNNLNESIEDFESKIRVATNEINIQYEIDNDSSTAIIKVKNLLKELELYYVLSNTYSDEEQIAYLKYKMVLNWLIKDYQNK